MDWFDNEGFDKFYLSSAKAPNKEALLRSFYNAWIDYWEPRNTLRTQTKSWVKSAWKDEKAKKFIKKRLIDWKFTPATVDGLFKKFSEWVKMTCK